MCESASGPRTPTSRMAILTPENLELARAFAIGEMFQLNHGLDDLALSRGLDAKTYIERLSEMPMLKYMTNDEAMAYLNEIDKYFGVEPDDELPVQNPADDAGHADTNENIVACSVGSVVKCAFTFTTNQNPVPSWWKPFTVIDKQTAALRVWMAAEIQTETPLDVLARDLLSCAEGVISELRPGIVVAIIRKKRNYVPEPLQTATTVLQGMSVGSVAPHADRLLIFQALERVFAGNGHVFHNVMLKHKSPGSTPVSRKRKSSHGDWTSLSSACHHCPKATCVKCITPKCKHGTGMLCIHCMRQRQRAYRA